MSPACLFQSWEDQRLAHHQIKRGSIWHIPSWAVSNKRIREIRRQFVICDPPKIPTEHYVKHFFPENQRSILKLACIAKCLVEVGESSDNKMKTHNIAFYTSHFFVNKHSKAAKTILFGFYIFLMGVSEQ